MSLARAASGWWSRHPWATAWLAVAVFALYYFASLDIFVECRLQAPTQYGVRGLLWGVLIGCLASVVQGMRIVRPRSRTRAWGAAFGVTVALLFVLLYPHYRVMGPEGRVNWAKVNLRAMVSSVERYKKHMGTLPASLTDLTKPATNGQGVTSEPQLAAVPAPPRGWAEYRYELRPDGTFTISSQGDDCRLVSASH